MIHKEPLKELVGIWGNPLICFLAEGLGTHVCMVNTKQPVGKAYC